VSTFVGETGRRLRDLLRYRGLFGTLKTCLRIALQPVLNRPIIINYRERRFDCKYRVDTAGIISTENLKIDGPSAAHAVHYQATQPVLLEEALADLRLNYTEYTFVDFGCGKGKVLLLASSFPFKKIIGVELSPELTKIAAANLTKYRSRKQRCSHLEVVSMDATEFPIPATPLVCFFYNPFKEEVMTRVLDNIEISVTQNPRDVVIIYVFPELDDLVRKRTFLVNIKRRPWCSLYRSNHERTEAVR